MKEKETEKRPKTGASSSSSSSSAAACEVRQDPLSENQREESCSDHSTRSGELSDGYSSSDSDEQTRCCVNSHKCSLHDVAPCERCFKHCCSIHTDGYRGGRICVKCSGLLEEAQRHSVIRKDDGDVTDLEDRQRELAFAVVQEHPKLPTRRRRKPIHREKIRKFDPPFYSCVARPVKKAEVSRTPAAQAALDKEWAKLRKAGCWDEKNVREWDDVVAEYRKKGKKAHVARLFEICVEKGSELPLGDPNRKFKGRVVLQGNQVKDEYWDQAIFAELSSCPTTMEAAKACDAYGLIPGHTTEQCDAEQAYTQAKITGTDTWVEIPRDQWPSSWKHMRRPVCLLILALYGHPDSGGYW